MYFLPMFNFSQPYVGVAAWTQVKPSPLERVLRAVDGRRRAHSCRFRRVRRRWKLQEPIFLTQAQSCSELKQSRHGSRHCHLINIKCYIWHFMGMSIPSIPGKSREASPIARKKITSACSRLLIQRYQVSWARLGSEQESPPWEMISELLSDRLPSASGDLQSSGSGGVMVNPEAIRR